MKRIYINRLYKLLSFVFVLYSQRKNLSHMATIRRFIDIHVYIHSMTLAIIAQCIKTISESELRSLTARQFRLFRVSVWAGFVVWNHFEWAFTAIPANKKKSIKLNFTSRVFFLLSSMYNIFKIIFFFLWECLDWNKYYIHISVVSESSSMKSLSINKWFQQ